MELPTIGKGWPDFFTRRQAEKLTGGGIDARTLANLDCLGEGPSGRFRLGRKTVYLREPFIEWIKGRMTEVKE